MSTRDLINAIAAGDAIEIENAFNSVMAEKVSARIDDMRIDVAQNLFAEQAEEIEEETELTLEDYSLEEIQDYMMSEDFEQLDEVSKETLKSYIKKASTDAGTDALKMIRRHKGDTVKTGRVEAGKNFRNIGKQRSAGISKALDKLTKEEIESYLQTEGYNYLKENDNLLDMISQARSSVPKKYKDVHKHIDATEKHIKAGNKLRALYHAAKFASLSKKYNEE